MATAACSQQQWDFPAGKWSSKQTTTKSRKRSSSRQGSSKRRKSSQKQLHVQQDPRNPNGKVVIDPVTKEKYFVCGHPGCGNKFTTRFSLKRHNKRHTGERPHQCPQCNRRFGEKSTLKRHLRTHTGERPFQCTFRNCRKSFADRTNVRRHMLTHMDQRNVTKAMKEEAWRAYEQNNPVTKSVSSHQSASDVSDDSTSSDMEDDAYVPRSTRKERMAHRAKTGSRKAVMPMDTTDAPVVPGFRKPARPTPVVAPSAAYPCPCDGCDVRAVSEESLESHLAHEHSQEDGAAMATLALLFLRRTPPSAPFSPTSNHSSDTEL